MSKHKRTTEINKFLSMSFVRHRFMPWLLLVNGGSKQIVVHIVVHSSLLCDRVLSIGVYCILLGCETRKHSPAGCHNKLLSVRCDVAGRGEKSTFCLLSIRMTIDDYAFPADTAASVNQPDIEH